MIQLRYQIWHDDELIGATKDRYQADMILFLSDVDSVMIDISSNEKVFHPDKPFTDSNHVFRVDYNEHTIERGLLSDFKVRRNLFTTFKAAKKRLIEHIAEGIKENEEDLERLKYHKELIEELKEEELFYDRGELNGNDNSE